MPKDSDLEEFCFCRMCGKRTAIESDMGTYIVVDNSDGRWKGDQYHYTKDGKTIFYYCNICGDALGCHPRAFKKWPDSKKYIYGPYTCGECNESYWTDENFDDVMDIDDMDEEDN